MAVEDDVGCFCGTCIGGFCENCRSWFADLGALEWVGRGEPYRIRIL